MIEYPYEFRENYNITKEVYYKYRSFYINELKKFHYDKNYIWTFNKLPVKRGYYNVVIPLCYMCDENLCYPNKHCLPPRLEIIPAFWNKWWQKKRTEPLDLLIDASVMYWNPQKLDTVTHEESMMYKDIKPLLSRSFYDIFKETCNAQEKNATE